MYHHYFHPMSDTLRILLIEDEQILREILVKKCISEGFLVEAAEDGPGGLVGLGDEETYPPPRRRWTGIGAAGFL